MCFWPIKRGGMKGDREEGRNRGHDCEAMIEQLRHICCIIHWLEKCLPSHRGGGKRVEWSRRKMMCVMMEVGWDGKGVTI